MKEYRSTEIVKAIQWSGENAGEIERLVRSEAMGSVFRQGNTLLIDTAFRDLGLQIGDYLIFKGQLVFTQDSDKFSHSYIGKSEEEQRAVEAFVAGCPLTPSKDNFCGVAVCGECDATKNFLKKLNETQP